MGGGGGVVGAVWVQGKQNGEKVRGAGRERQETRCSEAERVGAVEL